MTFEQAMEAFRAEFPGWWWKVGECHVSCDATISPDRYGPDEDLMAHRFFDDGFSVDLRQPSTVADALLAAMKIARMSGSSLSLPMGWRVAAVMLALAASAMNFIQSSVRI